MDFIKNTVQLETISEGELFELMGNLYISIKWQNTFEDAKELVAYNLNNKEIVIIDDFITSRYAVDLITINTEQNQ